MNKIFFTILIFFVMNNFALSTSHDDPHKNHVNMPFQEAMKKMHEDMMIKSTGNIDIDFLNSMIPHHQGAIDMSEELIKKSNNPELKALALKIINVQINEIKQMQDLIKKIEKE